ncbi:hypothetical protein FRC17_000221 [Serendipita sp. 399]|nr:hypothetical protein FRC17_000221 [Serendipita sp. 399]
MSSGKFKSLFALLIGIDNYHEPRAAPPLLGAVADAQAVERYLKEKLRIPGRNIATLVDKQATRANIIKGIKSLASNSIIKPGDPILIFFAGHGSEAPAPQDWHAHRGKVQLIIPHDYHMNVRTKGRETRVCGIPDRALGALLEDLAEAKGDNIVVILDTCHSGSGTRQGTRRVRSIRVTERIPEDLDRDIWGKAEEGREAETSRAAVSSGSGYYDDTSHVLLAACASNEVAQEVNRQGAFTRALLETLTKDGIKNLTYDQLIKNLPILPDQNPRCEGQNRNRIWFTTKTTADAPFYEVKTNGTYYILQAGSIQGVAPGAEFSLHPSRNLSSKPIGSVTAITVFAVNSLVEFSSLPPNKVPPTIFAVQTTFPNPNTLRVYISDDPKLARLRKRLTVEIESFPNCYTLVDRDRAKANFEIKVHGDTVSFAFVNSEIDGLGLTQLPFRISLKAEAPIMKVLKAASHFNRYYQDKPSDTDGRIDEQAANSGSVYNEEKTEDPVSIYLMKLTRTGVNTWRGSAPVNQNEKLGWEKHVNLFAENDRYGLKIQNNTNEGLYPYLFFLNCNDLSISARYMSPTVKGVDQDAPLQPNESMTIGYNAGGGQPWRYIIEPEATVVEGRIFRDAEDMQIDFFKLIFTTQPFDFSFMKQESPFNGDGRVAYEPPLVQVRKSVRLTIVTRKVDTIG